MGFIDLKIRPIEPYDTVMHPLSGSHGFLAGILRGGTRAVCLLTTHSMTFQNNYTSQLGLRVGFFPYLCDTSLWLSFDTFCSSLHFSHGIRHHRDHIEGAEAIHNLLLLIFLFASTLTTGSPTSGTSVNLSILTSKVSWAYMFILIMWRVSFLIFLPMHWMRCCGYPLGSLRLSLSLNVFKVVKGHPLVFTFVYFQMAFPTKRYLLTIDSCHELIKRG